MAYWFQHFAARRGSLASSEKSVVEAQARAVLKVLEEAEQEYRALCMSEDGGRATTVRLTAFHQELSVQLWVLEQLHKDCKSRLRKDDLGLSAAKETRQRYKALATGKWPTPPTAAEQASCARAYQDLRLQLLKLILAIGRTAP